MTNLTIRIASVVAGLLVGVVAAQAYPEPYRLDTKLPLLHAEIAQPDRTVTFTPARIEALAIAHVRAGDVERVAADQLI